MTYTPLKVDLPVCPKCGHIGKLPAHITRKDYCAGEVGNWHKSTKMVSRVFVEQPPDEAGKAAA